MRSKRTECFARLRGAMNSSREELIIGLAVTSPFDLNVRTTPLDYRAVSPRCNANGRVGS